MAKNIEKNVNLSLSVVIPVNNEEESLNYVLKDSLKDLPKYFKDFEIIIVDDGSTDNTFQIAKSYAKKNKNIRTFHQIHSGFNKAMITGIRKARKDYVAYMQGDGQDLIRDMVNCFRIMDKYDLVLGIRGKRIDYDFYRTFLSYGAWLLYRVLFGITYEDVHWIYFWKTEEIQKLKLDPNGGMFILVESLVKFQRKGLNIGEASAPYRPRYGGINKNDNHKVIIKTFISMIKLWIEIIKGKIK